MELALLYGALVSSNLSQALLSSASPQYVFLKYMETKRIIPKIPKILLKQ